jgi:PilZ domain
VSEADERAAAAERDLDDQRRETERRDIAASMAPPPPAPLFPPAPKAPLEGQPAPGSPVRTATRVAMAKDVDVRIDGGPAKLIDLSTAGAQILGPVALKPNRIVKLTLQTGDNLVSCQGKIMWARIEPGRSSGHLWYRAGVSFTNADRAALDEFLLDKK